MTFTNEQPADTREMFMAHDTFRREFALLPGLVRGVAAGDTDRAEIVGDHVELLRELLHHHHHAEDQHLWPRLLTRGSAELAPIVHVMEDQHRGIDAIVGELETTLPAWRRTADAARGSQLADALDRLVPLLDEHLKGEEESVLPLIETYVTADEWGRMIQDGAIGVPQERLPLLLGFMMYDGDPEVVDQAIAQMPPEVRPVIGDIARQAYAEHAERVHGTPTPAHARR